MDEIIRDAQPDDIPRIVEMGRRFLLEGPYKDQLADNPGEAAKFATNVMAHKDGHILVADKDGKPIGVIAFIVMPHWFSGETTATEMIWYVEPEHRPGGIGMRLLWEAEKQALDLGAASMGMTAPTEAVGDVYKRFGYRKVEVAYQKRLSRCQ